MDIPIPKHAMPKTPFYYENQLIVPSIDESEVFIYEGKEYKTLRLKYEDGREVVLHFRESEDPIDIEKK